MTQQRACISRPAAALLMGVLGFLGVPSRQALAEAPPSIPPAAAAPQREVIVLPNYEERPFPINLPTALQLANANPLDISLAEQRVQVAAAQLDRANVLWLPTIVLGADYTRHDGQIQDVGGRVFTTSRSAVMLGAGPNMVFAVTDALYAPLAARQEMRARQFEVQATRNDTLVAVTDAYFNVQQARGELAGAVSTVRRVEELIRRVEQLTPGLAPSVEVSRARAELSRQQQVVESAHERWQVASAELTRVLRLDPVALVEPVEEPHLRVDLLDSKRSVDDLIPIALTYRPELSSHQALVQATLARLRQEKIRPLVPSVVVRGNATNPGGTLSGGYFGGGINDNLNNFGGRYSFDAQLVWEWQNLGFGNHAAVREREAERQSATFALLRMQDRVAAEVVQALAQLRRSLRRAELAEGGLKEAIETADKNLQGLGQTRRVGEMLVLVFRPQEAVAAVQLLAQAYRDYYTAVADANRAQFRLYRALGQPADCVIKTEQTPVLATPTLPSPQVETSPSSPSVAPVMREQNPR